MGTGIQTVGQLTHEARSWISAADQVLHLVPDPVGEAIIDRLCPGRHRSLRPHYARQASRRAAYDAMVEEIFQAVVDGGVVCAAFYGHPGVFSLVPHEAISRVSDAGYAAHMLPGVSAEDCLFADLLVDPAASGCATYEATDLLIHRRVIDPTAALVVWQIGKLAVYESGAGTSSGEALQALVTKLREHYPHDHQVTLYEAATRPGARPKAKQISLRELPAETTRAGHTLYVPPCAAPRPDPLYEGFRP